MAKFIRQSVYDWKQFRNDIKKKNHMFEGKEFLGWDLPMHEQIRLYRIQEARIVEVANFTNFADNNPTAPQASAGKVLYKCAKKKSFNFESFQFAAGLNVNGSWTGSNKTGGPGIYESGAPMTSSISQNYIDIYTSRRDQGAVNSGDRKSGYKVRISFETGSVIRTNLGYGTDYRLTASYNAGSPFTTESATSASWLNAIRDTINNDYFLTNTAHNASGSITTTKASTFFSASVSSSVLYISSSKEGTTEAPMSTSFAAATASCAVVTAGEDVLCGADKGRWSNSDLKRADFPNVRRLKGTNK